MKIAALIATFCGYFICVWLCASYARTTYPNTGDEHALVFQSQVFAEGNLWAARPPESDFFWTDYVKINGGKWYGQYPPLGSILIAPFTFMNSPAAGVAFWGALNAVLFLTLCFQMNLRSDTIALALVLFGSSPSVLMHSASYYTHVTEAASLLAALNLICLYWRSPSLKAARVFGLAFGAMGAIRPFTGFLLIVPVAVWFCLNWRSRQPYSHLFVAIISAAVLPLLSFVHGAVLEESFTIPYWTAGNINIHLQLGSAFSDVIRRASELLTNTGRWFIAGYFEKGTPKIRSLYDVPFGIFLMGVTIILGLVSGFARRNKIGIVASLAAVFLIFGYSYFDGPMDGRFGGRYPFESLPLLYIALAQEISFAAEWAFDRMRAISVLVIAALIFIANTSIDRATLNFFHNDNLNRFDVFDQAKAFSDVDKIVFIKDVPVFSASWFARNRPNLTGSLFVPDKGVVDNARLAKAFPHKEPFLYEREGEVYRLRRLKLPAE